MERLENIKLEKMVVFNSDNETLALHKKIYNHCIDTLDKKIPEYNNMIEKYQKKIGDNGMLETPKEYYIELQKDMIEANQEQLKRLYYKINNEENYYDDIKSCEKI